MSIRFRRFRKKKESSYLELNLMPLIDVALNLLIIFMVTTPMLQQENALQIELPQGHVKETDDRITQQIVVCVDKKGSISIDGKKMSEKESLELVQKKARGNAEQTVFVKADTAASYGTVIELIDKIKHIGGVRYVALATTKID